MQDDTLKEALVQAGIFASNADEIVTRVEALAGSAIATVAGVSPSSGDIPVASLRTSLNSAQTVAGVSPNGSLDIPVASLRTALTQPTTVAGVAASGTWGSADVPVASLRTAFGQPTTVAGVAASGTWGSADVPVASLLSAFNTAQTSTWAARGSGSYVGQVKRISDIGPASGTFFVWDGTYWRLLAGRLCILQRWGTVATPLDTKTGATDHVFTLPATPTIPAGLITPYSQVFIRAFCKRTNANATAQFEARIGTLNSSSDNLALRVSLNATDNHVGRLDGPVLIGDFSGGKATQFISNGVIVPQSSTGAGSSYADRTTNFDTSAQMYVNFGVGSANASDSFSLHGYAVYLEP